MTFCTMMYIIIGVLGMDEFRESISSLTDLEFISGFMIMCCPPMLIASLVISWIEKDAVEVDKGVKINEKF